MLGALLTALGSQFAVMLPVGCGSASVPRRLLWPSWSLWRNGSAAATSPCSWPSASVSRASGSYLADRPLRLPASCTLAAGSRRRGSRLDLRCFPSSSRRVFLCRSPRGGARNARAPPPADRIQLGHILRFGTQYWLLVITCVTFYSVIFSFRSRFAIKYLQEAQGMTLAQAGTLNSYVFLAAAFTTPLFGLLLDRVRRNALLLVAGAALPAELSGAGGHLRRCRPLDSPARRQFLVSAGGTGPRSRVTPHPSSWVPRTA